MTVKRTMTARATCFAVILCVIVNQSYRVQSKNANLPKGKVKLVYKNKIANEISWKSITKINLDEQQRLEETIIQEQQRQQAEKEKQKQIEASTIDIEISYYSNTYSDCNRIDGLSASGKYLRESYIWCAAPSDVPFGTVLNISGLGTLTVVDRGSAIKWVTDNSGKKIMKLDVFIYNASNRFIRNKGTFRTTGQIIK